MRETETQDTNDESMQQREMAASTLTNLRDRGDFHKEGVPFSNVNSNGNLSPVLPQVNNNLENLKKSMASNNAPPRESRTNGLSSLMNFNIFSNNSPLNNNNNNNINNNNNNNIEDYDSIQRKKMKRTSSSSLNNLLSSPTSTSDQSVETSRSSNSSGSSSASNSLLLQDQSLYGAILGGNFDNLNFTQQLQVFFLWVDGLNHIQRKNVLEGLRKRVAFHQFIMDSEKKDQESSDVSNSFFQRQSSPDQDKKRVSDNENYDEKTKNKNDNSKSKRRAIKAVSKNMVCIQCGTSSSPEWRKGPDGIKSLCNACGLRFSKRARKLNNDISNISNHGKASFEDNSYKDEPK